MAKLKEKIKKSTVDVLFKKKQGSKFGYYYGLVGVAIFPMWVVMWLWILLEWLIEGQVTESLVDNLVALLCSITSFIVLLIGMFIGKELHVKEERHKIIKLAVEQLAKEAEKEKN